MQLLQILLGIQPFAALGVLALVRPRLPELAPDVALRDIRVGDSVASLRFRRRDDGGADHEVIDRTGTLRIVEVPPPADVDSASESLHDQLLRRAAAHAPGTTARALRIALGLE